VRKARAWQEPLAEIEKAILRLLLDNKTEHVIPEIVSLLRTTGADDATIKAAILRLNSEGRIELTPAWKIRKVL
jgi:hypothetical protein